MTNKSLSQRICEMCEIEPKRDCTNCPHPCEVACNNCSYSELIYPDFENNNNFVKLFNLNYTEYESDTIVNFVFTRCKNIINTSLFLTCLLFELQYSNDDEVEKVIKAIKQADWEL